MTGNQKAQFYLYNLKINDNRVIVKVNLQTVELFKEKGQRLGYDKKICTVDALICGNLGNMKTGLVSGLTCMYN